MEKFRTVVSVIVMVLVAIAGFFAGALLFDQALGGAVLFAMVAGFACVIYMLDNPIEK